MLDLWPEQLAAVPTADKVKMALELEAATRGRDARISGVRVAMFSDSLGEGAVATSTGIRAWGRAGTSYLMVQALAHVPGFREVENAKLFVYEEHPEQVAAHIDGFLSGATR